MGIHLYRRTRVLAVLLALTAGASAHHAPTGWAYPKPCCDNQDCRPIACSEITRQPDGSYLVGAVRFSHIGLSGDDQCHGCWRDGALHGPCLFAPTRM